jgi:hypothetical protein
MGSKRTHKKNKAQILTICQGLLNHNRSKGDTFFLGAVSLGMRHGSIIKHQKANAWQRNNDNIRRRQSARSSNLTVSWKSKC